MTERNLSNIEEYVVYLAKPVKDKDVFEAKKTAMKDLKHNNPGIYILVEEKIEEYKKQYPESEGYLYAL